MNRIFCTILFFWMMEAFSFGSLAVRCIQPAAPEQEQEATVVDTASLVTAIGPDAMQFAN